MLRVIAILLTIIALPVNDQVANSDLSALHNVDHARTSSSLRVRIYFRSRDSITITINGKILVDSQETLGVALTRAIQSAT